MSFLIFYLILFGLQNEKGLNRLLGEAALYSEMKLNGVGYQADQHIGIAGLDTGIVTRAAAFAFLLLLIYKDYII